MNEVLLTVSGNISASIEQEIADGKRPQADYVALAKAFDADLLDYQAAREQAGMIGRLIEKIAGVNFLLAWVCFRLRHRYRVIFTDGEQIGIPLAFLLKYCDLWQWSERQRAEHQMIVHILSVGKKMLFFDYLAIQSHIDIFFVYSSWQKSFIEQRWQVPAERVVLTSFMVDADFFSPPMAQQQSSLDLKINYPNWPLICAVGLEFRDYPTLMQAVEGLDVQIVIAAASPWSKRDDLTENQTIPDNVLVQRFTQYELRQLYAMSDFVTMPLYHVNFQAGVTALLEAMAMEKAIICTSTPGQTDVIIHDETGYYVPPEDPTTLRMAIQQLIAHPEDAIRMGENGRQRILQEMSLACYVDRLNRYVNPHRHFRIPAHSNGLVHWHNGSDRVTTQSPLWKNGHSPQKISTSNKIVK